MNYTIYLINKDSALINKREYLVESRIYNLEGILIRMTTNQIFLEATEFFYKNQYQKGLEKISQCLQSHPNNSTLLANRALFYSQMGHLQKAIEQLEDCIKLDYQNYIPYFNLFSLKVRNNQFEEALKDLCCSLSCLYLTRARFRKREQDTKQSIKYAKNNVQAHVLRGLMLLQAKKPKQCMNQLDWAYQFDPNLPTLNKIRQIVYKEVGLKVQTIKENDKNTKSVNRLQCSYEATEHDLMIEIKMKMIQFNSVYNDLNQQNGIVTHRVPRTLLPHEIEKLFKEGQFNEEIRELYELKYNSSDTAEPVIYQMKEEYRIQNQLQFQERLKQNDDDQQMVNSSSGQEPFGSQENQEAQNDSLIDRVDQADQQEISMLGHQEQQFIQNVEAQLSLQDEQQQSAGSFVEYLVVDQYPELPHEEPSNSRIQPNFSLFTEEKQVTEDYVESSISSMDNQEPCNLYPMRPHKKVYGRFKVIKFQIFNEKNITDFFEQSLYPSNANNQVLANRQMYCVSTYYKQKPGYKVTTCDRGLFLNSQSKRLQCEWQQTFKEILLSRDNPEQISVKIYSKNYNSYNDDLIGTGSTLVERNGQIIVPVSNVKSSQYMGHIYLKLNLVDK